MNQSSSMLVSVVAPSIEPRAVVIGTGRSGSGYIAEVLTAAGFTCGHESWWNPVGHEVSELELDSSWCALRDLMHRKKHIWTFMQTRDPLKVIASLTENPDFGEYKQLRESVLGPLPDDPLLSAIHITYWWTKYCLSLKPTVAWQVEAIGTRWLLEDVLIKSIAPRVRLGPMKVNIDAALAVPNNVNDHETSLELTWSDIPLFWRQDLKHLSEQLGYR